MSKDQLVRVNVALGEETQLTLKFLAERNKEPVAVLMRRLLAQEVGLEEYRDPVAPVIRTAVRGVVKPVEEALAKRAADATITAATAMYLGLQSAGDLGIKNALELHDRACRMAAEYVGRKKEATED